MALVRRRPWAGVPLLLRSDACALGRVGSHRAAHVSSTTVGQAFKVHYVLAYRDNSLADKVPGQLVMKSRETAGMFLQKLYHRTSWLQVYDLSKFSMKTSTGGKFKPVQLSTTVFEQLGTRLRPLFVFIPAYPPKAL